MKMKMICLRMGGREVLYAPTKSEIINAYENNFEQNDIRDNFSAAIFQE
jgi:hypothetical protein